MLKKVFLALCLIAVPLVAYAQDEIVNLALNPSFEEDEVILNDPSWTKWATWGDADGVNSKVAIDENVFIDGERSLRIEPLGAVNWYFIVLNLPIPTNKGKEYTASFWIKAEKDRPITAKMKATDNTIDWGLTDFLVTDQWAEYTFTAATLSGETKLEIFCAGSEVPFWLDFVSFYEGEYVDSFVPSEIDPNRPVESAGKLITQWAAIRKSCHKTSQ